MLEILKLDMIMCNVLHLSFIQNGFISEFDKNRMWKVGSLLDTSCSFTKKVMKMDIELWYGTLTSLTMAIAAIVDMARPVMQWYLWDQLVDGWYCINIFSAERRMFTIEIWGEYWLTVRGSDRPGRDWSMGRMKPKLLPVSSDWYYYLYYQNLIDNKYPPDLKVT